MVKEIAFTGSTSEGGDGLDKKDRWTGMDRHGGGRLRISRGVDNRSKQCL